MTTTEKKPDFIDRALTVRRDEIQQSRVPLANALIVVDVQVDFCPGGSLAVIDGDKVAQRIHDYVIDRSDDYKLIVASKCWHPDPIWEKTYGPFPHFSALPDFKNTWPPHCVQETPGAEFHENLRAFAKNDMGTQWPTQMQNMIEFDLVFFKGQNAAAYSAFEGTSMPSGQYDPPLGWTLDAYLKDKRVGHVDIVGLATDHCVRATALDAIKCGYDTTVLLDLCAGVDPDTTREAVDRMKTLGVHVE